MSINEPSVETSLEDATETSFGEQELSKLPDCVPMSKSITASVDSTHKKTERKKKPNRADSLSFPPVLQSPTSSTQYWIWFPCSR